MKKISVILSSILSIIFILILICLFIGIMGVNFINEKYYKKVINQIDLDKILLSDINEKYKDETVNDYLTEFLVKKGIEEDTAKSILSSSKSKKIINNLIDGVYEYYFEEGKIPSMDSNEIKSMISSELVNTDIENFDYDSYVDEVTNIINENISVLLTNNKLKLPNIIKTIIDKSTNIKYKVLSFCIIILAFYLILSLVNLSFVKSLKYTGISLLISGLLFSLPRVILPPILPIIVNRFVDVINILVVNLFNSILLYSIGVLVFGINVLIIYGVINNIREEHKYDDLDR